MACDHALAEAAGRGGPPVLRLYGWSPPALSLGYNQPARPLRGRIEALRAAGVGAVRRPTGGGAVLHARELTYAVALPRGHPALARGARAACARIHAGILAGLRSLGVEDLSLHGLGVRSEGLALSPAVCFAAPSRSEIAWRGRKLVGSAQRRVAGAILQHGSILLAGDQSELAGLWPAGSAPASVACLSEAAGRDLSPEDVAGAVEEGFGLELAGFFREAPLERHELRRVESLVEGCYGREDFLYRS